VTAAAGAGRRHALADELAAGGDLRGAAWRAAVEAVPREAFLGRRVYRRLDGPGPTLWEPLTLDQVGAAGWAELASQNVTWVTQFDGTDAPGAPGLLQGVPTSSSTLPGLVVRMLEDLDVRDGDRVLEIGTGTGYSAALLTARLGSGLVTSVEVDPGVAARAAAALRAAGYHPHLVTGDGLEGYADRAPYDKIIATCSVRYVPWPWLAQAAPGARIVVTLMGWLSGSGLAALTVAGDGTASGRFLPGFASFMPARAHAAPPFDPMLPEREGDERPARYGPEILDDWTGRFVAQLAAPAATSVQVSNDQQAACRFLTDHATGSRAWLTSADGRDWTATQRGPARIWDQIEGAIARWDDAGRPAQDQFTLHITPGRQAIRLDSGDTPMAWLLPAGSEPAS
jgi:methyltransferase of ATP-grasp peptide maturase system